jgi:hypothetical protein
MQKSDIGEAASTLTQAQFGDEISSHVALTKSEIDTLFPTQQDREQLSQLLNIVLNATIENNRRAQLIQSIGSVASAALKLLDKVIPA